MGTKWWKQEVTAFLQSASWRRNEQSIE
jgi:hypothetical protein